jgi:tRNA A37 N6-isopentenylltransferase MiaA
MLAEGFLDEVRALRAAGYGAGLKPMQALGYRQLGAVVDGTTTLADAAAETVRATHAYARRQRTWFKKEAASGRFATVPSVETALEVIAGGAPPALPAADKANRAENEKTG